MKIFVIKKKIILICCIISLVITAYFLYLSIFEEKIVMAVELMKNSKFVYEKVSDDWKKKITELPKGKEKIAFLTFDDGPSIKVTDKILDILKEEDVKASFFVIGKKVEEHPEIVKREYEEGHYIANHGYDHKNSKLYQSDESFIQEIKKTENAIKNAVGDSNYLTRVFRFPNGFMSPQYKGQKKRAVKLLEEMDYTYIDWNCLNNDSIKKYSNYELLANLKKSAKGKNTLVILMHDTKDVSNSSLVLEDSIKFLKEQGYTFKNFYDVLK